MSKDDTDKQPANAELGPPDAARAGEIRIAQAMSAAGHVHEAIHVLNHLLEKYPEDAESRAAADEMLSLAQSCQQRGQYYTALHLYRQLEQLA